MHRLPPGTEAPRWRVIAAVWGLSVLLALALSVVLRLTWGINAAVTLPLLWLAIQWVLWLHIKDRPARSRPDLYSETATNGPIVRLATMEEDSPHTGARSGDLGLGDVVDRPGCHSVKEEAEVTEPDPLQFTEEEIDHAVRVLSDRELNGDGDLEETARAVLRAVRAVPARCLNSGPAGHPARIGENVQGSGNGGRTIRGTVIGSYPVTTTVRTPSGETDYLWTSTIRSWDPSTEKALSAPAEQDHPVGISMATGRIVFTSELYDPALVADDDGMAVEEDR